MPNVITNVRRWRKKVLLVKSEVTYGTDPTPTGAANWIEARDITFKAYDSTDADRNIELPYLGNAGSVNVSKFATLSFNVAMVGSGAAGTAPKWGPLMLGGGFAETVTAATSVAYNLASDNLGSLFAYLNVDGVLYKFGGARNEINGKLSAKGIPLITLEMQALYAAPAAAGAPAVDRDGWIVEEAVNATNTGKLTLNAVDLAFSELNWACGNVLSRIDLPGPQREVQLVDRKPTAQAIVLAPALGVFNPYTLADAKTVVDLTNTHGSAAGKKVQTDLKVVIKGISETEIDGMPAYDLALEPTPVDGNDEIAITCL